MLPLRICVVTGSRADYGLLYPILSLLREDLRFDLQLVVTGMHLSIEFGNTVNVIESDGFDIAERVESLVSGDTPVAVTKSMALGLIGFADVFNRIQPDWVLVLGDRFEIYAAAQSAMVATIPIAHIAGGDTTEGAFDEGIRHSISKMSQLHFTTNEQSAKRLLQMGESPETVHIVGSPGIDTIKQLELMNRNMLETELNIRFYSRNLLITYHPVTLDLQESSEELAALLEALDDLGSDVGLYFTQPNADPGGSNFTQKINDWVTSHSNAAMFASLGQLRYLSLMKEVDVVVGNSSSGLYEAPSLKTATVNIGSRQRSRLAAESVIQSESQPAEILEAIRTAWKLDVSFVKSPYGDGNASSRIIELIASVPEPRRLLQKHFHIFPES
jgi:UDP-hydrolysing UDP-N-acetyl-D-glucosamine 2-epimerase